MERLIIIGMLLLVICFLCGIIVWSYTEEYRRWIDYKKYFAQPRPSYEMWSQKTRGK